MGFGLDTLVAPLGIVVFFVLSVKILIIDPGKQCRTGSSSKNHTRKIHQRTN
jgi:hypothetical protein